MRARPAVWSVAGPGAFALAAAIGGRLEPGYRARDEPISALAATGTRSAKVMVPGFLALAAGSVGLARSLRGSVVAPRPVPAMLTVVGLATAGAGLARCSDRSCPTRMLGDTGVTTSDDLHVAFSMVVFGLWVATPLMAARRTEAAASRYRRASRALGLATLAGLVGGGTLARRSDAWSGAIQRATVTSALAWYVLAGVTAARADAEPGASTVRAAAVVSPPR